MRNCKLRLSNSRPEESVERRISDFTLCGEVLPVCLSLAFPVSISHEITQVHSPGEGGSFSGLIIAYVVWTYHRFALSTGDVEDLNAERGVLGSRETVCVWINRFGRHLDDCIRKGRLQPNDKAHIDEVVIMISGKKFWLWRTIDADGDVLGILVQNLS